MEQLAKKGLTAGDLFDSDGRTYKVKEVLPSGDYISEAVTRAEPERANTDNKESKRRSAAEKQVLA